MCDLNWSLIIMTIAPILYCIIICIIRSPGTNTVSSWAPGITRDVHCIFCTCTCMQLVYSMLVIH